MYVEAGQTISGLNFASNEPVPITVKKDNYTVAEEGTLSISAPGVLENDSSNGVLTAAVFALPTNGALTLNADGSFSYVPQANFSGQETFHYRVSDGLGNEAMATVTVTVTHEESAR